ncbi:MAG: DUF1569 domain-containing protein [Isosphaeraceae bacterium]
MRQRRSLDFQSLGEVLPDVERLLEGHETVGRWTLGQILEHLSTAIRLSLLPPGDPSAGRGSEALRKRFFERRRFPEGAEAPHPRLIPNADAEPRQAAADLRDAIGRWDSTTGPFPEHPLLGTLTKDEWHQFHCIHCAHHLSFAIPA